MWLNSFLLITGWFICEFVYFRIAERYAIIDKPNVRSSHQHITIRGGGIIFPIAILIGLPYDSFTNVTLSISLLLIALLSFTDDIRNIDSKTRLLIQSVAVAGMLLSVYDSFSWVWLFILFVLVTGIINAYNFMDGINGITVLYSLVTLTSVYLVSSCVGSTIPDLLFLSLFTSLLVFAFFNLRKKAKCFSGDVGAVTLAFIFCYLILSLSVTTGSGWWILFLGVYGIDAVFTIVCRIFRKELLFEAHRSHFYQYLANEAGWSHIKVSLLFASSQLILNLAVIYAYFKQSEWIAVATLFVFLTIYSIFRLRLEGHKRLFVTYNSD